LKWSAGIQCVVMRLISNIAVILCTFCCVSCRYDQSRLTHWVEDLTGRTDIHIQVHEPKEKVYIRNIQDSVVTITGKCTMISIENARGSGVIFDDVIATLEVINSQKLQLQVNGTVPSLQLDKTHGASVFIQTPGGLDVNIVTSQCTGLNIMTPGVREEDDMIETPIPEQFVTVFDHERKKWKTHPTEHSGV